MKVVALVSGGKDSCYAMMRCIDYDHEIVALANLLPEDDSVDEMDSYMYQTVGHQIVISYAECMGLPLFRRRIQGSARHKDLCYKENLGDEVEDMYVLLNEVKQKIPSVTAVCSGAIASDYQRLRVESVCSRLNLVSLAYLWKQEQTLLLDEMINKGIVAIIIKVAALGLNPTKHLGKTIVDMQPSLLHLKELYGINVCGEGGEYESLTLDCPLFKNARIVLENFRVIPHSMDSIAPVGILHPVSFYLERKNAIHSISNSTEICDTTLEKIVDVHEVLDVHQHRLSSDDLNIHSVILTPTLEDKILHISTAKGKTFSVGCWISSASAKDLQEDLEAVLWKIELRLGEDNLGWVNVLYIHLYISDMKEFTIANEVYLRFITEQKCCFGVPSRSTIELPLTLVNLGNAYIEVLVAEDVSKRVLHVQSISCWAPSCIGPYSQATLHKEILFMAGQLGLDPPTMLLCSGGPLAELDQTLKNCEAVAESFDCSIASSAIFLLMYCSASLTLAERIEVQHRKESFLHKKISELPNVVMPDAPSTIFLYVLAPNLPKSALLEIKPLLYVPNYAEALDLTNVPTSSYPKTPHYWDFELFDFNDSCSQKFVVSGKICAVAVSIVNDVAAEICSITDRNAADFHCCDSSEHLLIISRFCLYLLHQTLVDGSFSWSDLMSLRIYVSTGFCTDIDMLNRAFSDAFAELAETDTSIHISMESIFTLIPVLSSGRSAIMNDLVTCELLASKS